MSNNLASNNEFSFPYEDSSDITLESITRYLADLTGYSITSDIMGGVDLLHDLDSEQKKNERLSIQIVQTLASALDARDSYTRGHSSRVALYSLEIARRYGYSEKAQIEIYMMALLHDIGKIGIPDKVLRKKSQLTDKEYDLIKTHPVVGYEILNNITDMPRLGIGARWHHERYDGNGYPDGLIGTDIPEEARIISVADAYDAMSSSRCYNDNFTQEYIIKELAAGKGNQFDPVFTDIMLSIVNDGKTYSNQ